MEDRERILYQIMGALHKVGAPLIFKGAVGKPAFEEVYSYMETFLRPFIGQVSDDMLWNSQGCVWETVVRQPKRRLVDR